MLAVLLDPASPDAGRWTLDAGRNTQGERQKVNNEQQTTSNTPFRGLGGFDFFFVGGSGLNHSIDTFVQQLKSSIEYRASNIEQPPIVLFPGSVEQFTPEADCLLFLSLLSGRNAEMLIGQQVRAARKVRQSGIETISMGYILVDGGKLSSVEKASGTHAIPANEVDTIVDTALAGELLGMQLIYLEAGSGAHTPIAPSTIQAVREAIDLPLIVGGGICTIEQMNAAFNAGADLVVIGNHFEQHPEEIWQFASAKMAYNQQR